MSWSFSARLVTGRRALAVCVAVVTLAAAGVAFGARFQARAAVLGSVAANDPSSDEGSAVSPKSVTFSVQPTGPVLSADTVTYTTVDGTAKANEDYKPKSGTLTFTNTTAQQVVVELVGDTLSEPNETFKLQLSGGSSNDNFGTATIVNDDFGLTIDDVAVDEGNSGPKTVSTVINLEGGPRQTPTTVQFDTINGTASAPSDYTARNAATATIPAGQTQTTITFTVQGDALYEDAETFRVLLTNPSSGVAISDGDATITIRNDDPLPAPEQQPQISLADKTFTEGNNGTTSGTLTATLSAPVPYTVTAKASTADGTSNTGATAPSDYANFTGQTIAFAPGDTTAQLPITVNGDTKDEFDETFSVSLSNPSQGARITDTTADVTITDDDPTPGITIANAQANEGSKVTFTLTLSAASGRKTVVSVGTADGTAKAGQDFNGLNGATNLVEIQAGETTKTVDVETLPDAIQEADETFQLIAKQATNPDNSAFGDPVTATGTIKDTNTAPGVAISDVSKDEGNSATTTFDFTVTLTPKSGQTVKVNYTVGADSTGSAAATPGADFAPATGQLTFAPDETTKTISVAVVGDTVAEDNETFVVTLSNPQNTSLTDGVGTGTIKNDDGTFFRSGAITTGAGAGGGSHVRLFAANGQPVGGGFFATVNGPGVRVARGDLDGDGHDEIIASSGRGGPSTVRVFTPDGAGLVAEVEAYPGFTGGVSIAAADIDNDGKDEIVTGALAGGGPHVRTFDLTGEPGSRSLVGSQGFYGSQRAHTGGINVAAGDTDGDGRAEIMTAIASGGAPAIGVFKYNPATNEASQVGDAFLAFDERFLGGVNIAVGDLDGDNKVEIVVGAGPGGAPHVRAFSPIGGGYEFSLYAYGAGFTGGVQVAVGDINADGQNEVVTGVGAGGGPHVRAFDFDTKQPLATSFYAYDEGFTGGVNVAVGKP